MSIIEVMKYPSGTLFKSNINEKTMEITEDFEGDRFLRLYGDFRRLFVDSVLTNGEFYLIGEVN